MSEHQKKDEPEHKPQPPGKSAAPSSIDDVAGKTRESVADTVTPLRIAIENLAMAVPDATFVNRYADAVMGRECYLSCKGEMSDEFRDMNQRRECFNEALVRLFESALALHRDLSEEEIRSIGILLRTAGDLPLAEFITTDAMERMRTLALQLFAEHHFSFLSAIVRYGTMDHYYISLSGGVAHALATSATQGHLPHARVLGFFERTLADAANDDERDFRTQEGLANAIDYVFQNDGDPTAAVQVAFRGMERTLREMGDVCHESSWDRRFYKILTDPHWSRHAQGAVTRWLKEKAVSTDNFSHRWSEGIGGPITKTADYDLLSEEQRAKRMNPIACYMRNVRHCMRLETCRTGCLRELAIMFNLYDVGRYDVQTLIEQYEERENIHKPYVLVIFPRDDHNGAFFCNADVLENLRQQLEKEGHLLRIIEGGDDILKTLARLRRDERYPLPAGLVLGAHGQPNSMHFSQQHPLSLKAIERKTEQGWEVRMGMEEGMEKLFQRKAKRCPTVLFSCSTGQPEGIAHVISRYTEGTVIGPQIPTNVAAIRSQFENGKLTALVPTFHQGKTGTFVAGKEVPVAEEEVLEALPVEEELPPEEKR